MSIRTRLLCGLLVVAVAFGAVAAWAFSELKTAREHTVAMREQALEPLAHLTRLKSNADDAVNWSTFMRFESATVPMKDSIKGTVEGDLVIGEELANLRNYQLPQQVKDNLAKIAVITSGLEKLSNNNFKTEMRLLDPSVPETPIAVAGAALNDRSAAVSQSIDLMVQKQHDEEAVLNDAYQTARRNLIIALTGAAAVAVAMALVIARSVVRPVRRTVEVLERVADGDLTPRLEPGKDEIGQMGQALNRTLDQVGEVIGAIDQSAVELSARSAAFTQRSTELAATAAAVSADASAASNSVHDVTGGVAAVSTAADELKRSVDDVADRAAEATRVAGKVEEAAAVTREAMSAVAGAGPADEGVRSRAARAAGAVEELAAVVAHLNEIEAGIAASVDSHRDVAGSITAALAMVSASSDDVDVRIDAVAAALELTSQFVSETRADAELLSALSDQLETLTAVFHYEPA